MYLDRIGRIAKLSNKTAYGQGTFVANSKHSKKILYHTILHFVFRKKCLSSMIILTNAMKLALSR